MPESLTLRVLVTAWIHYRLYKKKSAVDQTVRKSKENLGSVMPSDWRRRLNTSLFVTQPPSHENLTWNSNQSCLLLRICPRRMLWNSVVSGKVWILEKIRRLQIGPADEKSQMWMDCFSKHITVPQKPGWVRKIQGVFMEISSFRQWPLFHHHKPKRVFHLSWEISINKW